MSAFVSRFSPGEMPPELLERIFTQERRRRLADDLVGRARDSALTGSKYHDLLVGERGMGKTHLVSVVAHRLMAMDDLKERLAIAWLVEEEWGVASFFDLLMRLFRALDPILDDGQRHRVDALLDIVDDETAQARARSLLLEVLGERTLLVIAENLDDIFAGLGDAGQKSLRAFVQESRQVALLATTPALFAGVSAHTEAFYGFFRLTHLEEFDLDDARTLIRQVAEWRGDTKLVDYLATEQATARLKTVATLTGGLPRLYVVFADLLSAASLDELVDAFLEMLDDLNDYFRNRMERLSRTQQKVVEYLCRLPGAHQDGTLVKAVARQCRISPSVASKEIERLVGFGYLRPYAVGRETYYDLREPMLRLWHEKKQGRERPVRLLVEYLKCWFERDDLTRWLSISEPGTLAHRHLEAALVELPNDIPGDTLPASDALQKVARLYQEGRAFYGEHHLTPAREKFQEALAIFEDLLSREPGVRSAEMQQFAALLFNDIGFVHQSQGHLPEALRYFQQAYEIDVKVAPISTGTATRLNNIGSVYCAQGNLSEALRHFQQAYDIFVKISPASTQTASTLNNIGGVYHAQGNLSEALRHFQQAYDIDVKVAPTSTETATRLNNIGSVYQGQGDLSEALRCYQQAYEINVKVAPASIDTAIRLNNIGGVYRAQGNLSEAEPMYRRALEILEQALGPDHPDTTIARESLIHALCHVLPQAEAGVWSAGIAEMLALSVGDKTRRALAAALTEQATPQVAASTMTLERAEAWRDAWAAAVPDARGTAMEVPLRLLDTVVRYKAKPDPRVALRLPPEERVVLEQILRDAGLWIDLDARPRTRRRR